MPVINRIAEFHAEMSGWRRDIHAHPEIAFQERRTSDLVAAKLAEFGLEVTRGLAGTGVVGTLRGRRPGDRAVGLRADMDALTLEEKNGFAHRSQHPGHMHACGHDGHTTMLLGAAKYLAETRNFAGTTHFIFQPAEENEGGGQVMVEEGLFEKFPVEEVYGMHNMPGMPVGTMGVRVGTMMAAADRFDLIVRGKGTHAAMPHLGRDPIVAAAQVVTALQAIASRATDPLDALVVSVTQFHAGTAYNIIPDDVVLRGTVRTLSRDLQSTIPERLQAMASAVAGGFGCTAELDYRPGYPATVNTEAEVRKAAAAAADVVGERNLDLSIKPLMGAEDFAFMLEKRPGAYVWIGNGPGEGGCTLHNPHYDFNDDILTVGASYWARLVETTLAG